MFELYKVNAPVLIKSRPSASSTTVNSIDKGKTIEVVSEEDGWLKTISGRYVLNSNRLTKMADVDEEILNKKYLD